MFGSSVRSQVYMSFLVTYRRRAYGVVIVWNLRPGIGRTCMVWQCLLPSPPPHPPHPTLFISSMSYCISLQQLSYADIVFFNLINYAFGQGKLETPNDLKEYPLLQKHFELVMNIPNIKKWLQERPLTDL